MKELIENYGPFFEVWFDGANGGDGFYGGKNEKRKIDRKTYYDWPTTIAMVKKMNANVMFFSDAGPGCRWGGNEDGFAGETNWNTITLDTLYPGKSNIEDLLNTGAEDGKDWTPIETDISIRPGWFYHKEQDSLVKTPEELFDIYLKSVGRGSLLLLNIPPDRRGMIHENDAKSLSAFKRLLDSTFKTDLAVSAKIKASNIRDQSELFDPKNLLDNNFETYWASDNNQKTATIEIDLKEKQHIKYIVLQEYIKLGQRVKSFTVEARVGEKWQTIAGGTTIGYKRILKVNRIQTTKIKVTIIDSKASPILSKIGLY